MKNNILDKNVVAKPFVKWAGGKKSLLQTLIKNLPLEFRTGGIDTYVEPFVGGGALFFSVKKLYPNVKNFVLCDINSDLMLTYKIIRDDVSSLTRILHSIEEDFVKSADKKNFYYSIREKYNKEKLDEVEKAAFFIFLNKTCFNGLYRVNSKGEFNVPFGRYKNPKICDENNLYAVSNALKETIIISGDFEIVRDYINDRSFVYLDPPYKPISKTSNFTSYHSSGFGINEQERLATFFREMDKRGAKLMLSNSYSNDKMLQRLYSGYFIKVVDAKRFISASSSGRGTIKEILVMNYGGENG